MSDRTVSEKPLSVRMRAAIYLGWQTALQYRERKTKPIETRRGKVGEREYWSRWRDVPVVKEE